MSVLATNNPIPPAVRATAALLLHGLLLAVLGMAPASAQSDPRAAIDVDVERDGERFIVEARADLEADARTAWDTLVDYERMPQFVPGLQRTRVLSRTGGAQRQLTVEYIGESRLLFMTLPTRLWLDVQHVPFTDVIAQSAPAPAGQGAPTVKDLRARYTLAVVGTSGRAAPRVRLTYSAQFELTEALPPILGALFGTAAMRQSVREQFGAMVGEIERRARARPSIEAGVPEGR
jgi:hypothetical protein